MGYGLGYAAAGAANGLSDLIKQRLEQARLQETVRTNRAHEAETAREHDLRDAEFKDTKKRLDIAELNRRGTQLGMGRTPAGDVNDEAAKALDSAGFLVTHNNATLPSTQSVGVADAQGNGLGRLVTKQVDSGPGFNHFEGGALYQSEQQSAKDKREYQSAERVSREAQKEADRQSRADIAADNNLTRQTIAASKPDHAAEGQLNRSYQYHRTQLDKLAGPVEQTHQKLSELNDLITQGTPQADAMLAPKLLSTMVGGQGSGLRMNEAEINRIMGGRSKWESFKAAANQWSLDPKTANSITPEQRQQIHALYAAMSSKVDRALQAANGAGDELVNAGSAQEHRQIYQRARKNLQDVFSGENTQAAAGNGARVYYDMNGNPVKR
jgi:hypothetical protein